MTADTIRFFLKRTPFRPFAIHLNDGRRLEVLHPDFLLLPPGWQSTAIVAFPKELFEFVDVRNIASIASEGEIPAMPPKPRREDQSE